MKATVIILLSIGLFALIKDADAGINIDAFFNKYKDAITRKALVELVMQTEYLKNPNSAARQAAVEKAVAALDVDRDGIELKEIQANQDMVQALVSKFGKAIDELFNEKKDAIQQETLVDILGKAGYKPTSGTVETTVKALDKDSDGGIDYLELTVRNADMVAFITTNCN